MLLDVKSSCPAGGKGGAEGVEVDENDSAGKFGKRRICVGDDRE